MYKVLVMHLDGTETSIIAENKMMASFVVASVVSVLSAAGIVPNQDDLDTMHEDETTLTLHMMKGDMVIATITAKPIVPMSLH